MPNAGYTGADKRVKRKRLMWQIAGDEGRAPVRVDGGYAPGTTALSLLMLGHFGGYRR